MTENIRKLNQAPRDEAIAATEPLVERSAWVAEMTVDARPFADHHALAAALVETILQAGFERRLAMFNAHQELAGVEASEDRMTRASISEQQRLGLWLLSPHDTRRLADLNAAYRERFGHPFIVALHRVGDVPALFDIFERRLRASAIEEHAATLAEIASVIHARAASAFGPAAASSHATATNQE
jgi:OHCU decarboxylase